MSLPELEAWLESANPQLQMKAIISLRNFEPDIAVPLLKRRMYDKEFTIRSFVAKGFGHQRNDEAFEALLTIFKQEQDNNVVAEAASSLAKFGPQALPHLEALFEQNPHWLVRLSIFAAMEECNSPDSLLRLCNLGLEGDDQTVKLAALSNLKRLKGTPKMSEALEIALQYASHQNAFLRAQVTGLLRHLGGSQAEAALGRLSQDPDSRVVKAVLEGLL